MDGPILKENGFNHNLTPLYKQFLWRFKTEKKAILFFYFYYFTHISYQSATSDKLLLYIVSLSFFFFHLPITYVKQHFEWRKKGKQKKITRGGKYLIKGCSAKKKGKGNNYKHGLVWFTETEIFNRIPQTGKVKNRERENMRGLKNFSMWKLTPNIKDKVISL